MKRLLLLLGIVFFGTALLLSQSQIIEDFSVIQCDSLIKANVDNPNFVILDVRTPAEYIPQHLEGAIMRDFYASDFENQLNQLNKSKRYLIHCRSGGRSGVALNQMKNLGFEEVYNMLGGINAWNAKSLPTTSAFAPKLMFVLGPIFKTDTVSVGDIDTTMVTITNRANDTLKLNKFSIIKGDDFSSDIDLPQYLLGAEDYTFHIYYKPTVPGMSEGKFSFKTNAGFHTITVQRIAKGTTATKFIDNSIINIFPNPTRDFIKIDGIPNQSEIQILNLSGQIILKQRYNGQLDVSNFENGVYWIIARNGDDIFHGKFEILR